MVMDWEFEASRTRFLVGSRLQARHDPRDALACREPKLEAPDVDDCISALPVQWRELGSSNVRRLAHDPPYASTTPPAEPRSRPHGTPRSVTEPLRRCITWPDCAT